jgi:transcriptional regulator NrdR family protein
MTTQKNMLDLDGGYKMYVIKRNGEHVPFDKQKIINAINKAMIEVDGDLYEIETAESIAEDIYEYGPTPITVEEIQDMVEYLLMESERKDVAKAYIRFRFKKEMARRHYEDFIDAISQKIQGTNIENQNANVDEQSFGGRYGEAADLLMKKYALDYCVSEMARMNHVSNMIYIHDLSAYAVGMHNCLSIPFDDLLAKGFNTRQTDVRPANSVSTMFQLFAVLFDFGNGKGIAALIFRVAGVAFDPDPLHGVHIQQSKELFPEIHIQRRAALTALPVVAFPVVDPAFGDRIDQIFGNHRNTQRHDRSQKPYHDI